MQAIGRQPERAPDGAPLHYQRRRPEQTTLYRLVQQHAASFVAHTAASTGADLRPIIGAEFNAFFECGILAHGSLRLRCGDCGHDKLLAFSCKRRGFCPSCGARRMSQTAAHRVDHVIPHVPLRHWVLSRPLPLRVLLVPQASEAQEQANEAAVAHECEVETPQARPGRISWARLLKRVFDTAMQALHELRRRGTEDHRGHPGAAGDREGPDLPGTRSAAAAQGPSARGAARLRHLSRAGRRGHFAKGCTS